MDTRLVTGLLVRRAAWRSRDRWSPAQLARHQEQALAGLRAHAYARSAFYRRHHNGLRGAPLAELPPVTKADLMAHWDEVVTAGGLTLADMEGHLRLLTEAGADPGMPWRHQWWTAATAGTTGRRGVFVWGRLEWGTVLASYARASDWAGIPAGVTHPLRTALVSSLNPAHQSAVVGATLASRMVPTLRLDVTAPVEEQVAALNAFGPRLLVGYASALRPLAQAQLAGSLRIRPQRVMSASEVLTGAAAQDMRRAWGSAPVDVYAATETAGVASPCRLGTSHVYEDLLIVEPVDEAGRPVPPGVAGAKLWVSVLFSRTLPLVRYEISDRVVLAGRGCACGRPFRVLDRVEGRQEDVLTMTGRSGPVRIHPNVFHEILDDASTTGWQVRQNSASQLSVLLAGPPQASDQLVAAGVAAAVQAAGADPPRVTMHRVETIPRTPLGKAPLVVAQTSARTHATHPDDPAART